MEKARSPTQHLCNLSTVPLLLHELHSIGNTEAQLGAFVLDLLKIAVVDPKQATKSKPICMESSASEAEASALRADGIVKP